MTDRARVLATDENGSGIDASELVRLEALVDRGFYLTVNPEVDRLILSGQPRAVCLAVRALRFLGATRQGNVLSYLSFRRHPHEPQVFSSFLRQRLNVAGAEEFWRRLERAPLVLEKAEVPRDFAAEMSSLRGRAFALVRDFEPALRAHEEALERCPGDPWLWIEKAYSLEAADRIEEALDAVSAAEEKSPGYRAALQLRAQLLTKLSRSDEAVALLRRAFADSECSGIGVQLYHHQRDAGCDADAALTLKRIEQLMPRRDERETAWLNACWVEVYLSLGEYEKAEVFARRVGKGGYHAALAERLATRTGATMRRVVLPVELVPQHHNTCAPATLTALCRYWERPADHLEVAERICYDGTPATSERIWAEEQGFYVKEFRFTWDVARALLDRGIPFALTTRFSVSGHLQAVHGYDELRRTIFVRDPSETTRTEYDVETLVRGNASSGPRATLLLPREECPRLEGIELPDAEPWDLYHEAMVALTKFELPDVRARVRDLEERFPDHRLTLQAQRSVAVYEGGETRILELTEQLLLRYPDDVPYQLSKAASLYAIGGEGAHVGWLRELAKGPSPDAAVLLRLADRLSEDFRNWRWARALLRMALRRAPSNATVWSEWGGLLWLEGKREAALRAYRAASCLAETDEGYAAGYQRACSWLGRAEEGLAFLRARAARLGTKSHQPFITLYEQLDALDRTSEAEAALAQALSLHPENGALLLYVAEARISTQRFDEAAALLARADGSARPSDVLAAKSRVAEAKGEDADALDLAERACQLDPLNTVKHSHRARLIERRDGKVAAVRYLEEVAAQNPKNFPLLRLLYDWVPDTHEDNGRVLALIRSSHPGDGWALRESALQASREKKHAEAFAFATEALERAPTYTFSQSVMAAVRLAAGGYEDALPYLREALRLSVDNEYAVTTSISMAPTLARCEEMVRFIAKELVAQTTRGDGVLALAEAVVGKISPKEIYDTFVRMHDARPDLWQTWVALGNIELASDRGESALDLLHRAAERFPSIPRIFLEKAEILQFLARREEAVAVVLDVIQMSPGWHRPLDLLVDIVCDEGGPYEPAEKTLRQATQRRPHDAALFLMLGRLLEAAERFDEALEAVRTALRLQPEDEWSWKLAHTVASEAGKSEELEASLVDYLKQRPAETSVGLLIVRAETATDPEQGLAAAEQAIRLDATNVLAWKARLSRLLELSREEDVLMLVEQLAWPGEKHRPLLRFRPKALRALGRLEEAIHATKHLLVDEASGTYELLQLLADLRDERDENEEYLEVSSRLVELSPGTPASHGYLGHALKKLGRYAEAKAPLGRALDLDPSYYFGRRQLLETLDALHEGEAYLDQAERAWAQHSDVKIADRALAFAAEGGERERVLRWASRVAEAAGHGAPFATRALETARSIGAEKEFFEAILELLREKRCSVAACRVYIEATTKLSEGPRLLKKFASLRESDQNGTFRYALLSAAVAAGEKGLVRAMGRAYEQEARTNDEVWSELSWAWLQIGDLNRAATWAEGAFGRPDLPSWGLHNAALALANLGKFASLRELTELLLSRDPKDRDTLYWSAVFEATLGDERVFSERLEALEGLETDEWMASGKRLLRAYLDALVARDSAIAAPIFRELASDASEKGQLRALRRHLGSKLLRETTRPLVRPFRWWSLRGPSSYFP